MLTLPVITYAIHAITEAGPVRLLSYRLERDGQDALARLKADVASGKAVAGPALSLMPVTDDIELDVPSVSAALDAGHRVDVDAIQAKAAKFDAGEVNTDIKGAAAVKR